MKIEQWSVEKVIPYERNPRINEGAVEATAKSIEAFGFRQPIVVDKDGVIVVGHTRLKAAQSLGLKKVPVHVAELTEAEAMAYRIADNKTGELAEWDEELLAAELRALDELEFDLDLTGFGDFDLDGEGGEGNTDADDVPEPPAEPKSKLGQIWKLGEHRLMCGDSTSLADVEKLMGGGQADMVLTDPPYGISIVSGSKVGGGGAFGGKKNERADKSNVIPSSNFAPVAGDDSINVALKAIKIIQSLDPKVQIIWGGNYYANALPNSSCWIVWDKQNSGNFADCELAWTNQKTAVRLFKHMWNGMVKDSEHGQKRVHPTQKPVALSEWCINQYGSDSKTVLDLFLGSGSTLIACEKTGRRCYCMELAPQYCDVIIRRWEEYTGKNAELVEG